MGCLPHLVPNCTQPREMGSGWCFHSCALHITSTRNIIPVDYFLLVLDSCLKPATINQNILLESCFLVKHVLSYCILIARLVSAVLFRRSPTTWKKGRVASWWFQIPWSSFSGFNMFEVIPMTDPWCWYIYIYANMTGVYWWYMLPYIAYMDPMGYDMAAS